MKIPILPCSAFNPETMSKYGGKVLRWNYTGVTIARWDERFVDKVKQLVACDANYNGSDGIVGVGTRRNFKDGEWH